MPAVKGTKKCLCFMQMLAFSLLDAIVEVDWQQRWLKYLSLKGYLRHMVEGLAHEDHILQSMLNPSPEPLKVTAPGALTCRC